MASYATLLEEANIEEKYQNETFSELASYLESVTAFVNEDVEFNVMISLTEAESGEIKEKDSKISKAVKNGIQNLITRIEKFITMIGDAVKRFVAKAHVVIASKGNNAMAKMLKDNSLTIGKDITLTSVIKRVDKTSGNSKDIDTLLKKAEDAAKALATTTAKINANTLKSITDARSEKELKAADDVIEAFSEDIATAKHSDAAQIKANEAKKVSEVYAKYVANILDPLGAHLKKIESTCHDGQKAGKEVIATLKKTKDNEASAELLKGINDYMGRLMKLDAAAVNFASRLLTIATKNSAKIALAAVDAQGRSAAAAVSGKVKDAKDTVSRKAKAAKEA